MSSPAAICGLMMVTTVLLSLGVDAAAAAALSFTEGPADLTVAEGGAPAVLSCRVDGVDPALQVVSFERNHHVVADGTAVRGPILADMGLEPAKYRVSLDLSQASDSRRYTLTVQSPDRVDAGSFRCLVCRKDPTSGVCDANAVFKASGSAQLVVTYPPADVEPRCTVVEPELPGSTTAANASELTLGQGRTAVFLCTSGEANPPVELIWTRDGVAVPDDVESEEGEDGQRASRLRLTVSAPRDNGTVLACSAASPVYNGSCRLPPLLVTGNPDSDGDGHGQWSRSNVIVIAVLAAVVVCLSVAIVAAYVARRRKGRRGAESRGHQIEYHPADTADD